MTVYRIAFKGDYDPTYYYQEIESENATEDEALKIFRDKFPSQEVIAISPLKEYDVFYVTTEYHRAKICEVSEEDAKRYILGAGKPFWSDKLIKRHNEIRTIKEVSKEEKE